MSVTNSVFARIYFTSFCHAMQQQMDRNLSAYVTSEFQRHGLTATTGIVSGLMYGVSQLPIARILNIFGRMEGYIFCHICCSFGLFGQLSSRIHYTEQEFFKRSYAYGCVSKCRNICSG
jgi:hypothetical protein